MPHDKKIADAVVNIRAVINTLNLIGVSGRENLDRLLGCIMLMERTEAALKDDKEGAAE